MHPRSDVKWLYISQKNGARGLIGHKNSMKSEENGLGQYIKDNIELLLVAVRTRRTITHEETVDPKEFNKTKEEQKMNGLEKECMDNLLEIWRTRTRTTHGDG